MGDKMGEGMGEWKLCAKKALANEEWMVDELAAVGENSPDYGECTRCGSVSIPFDRELIRVHI